MEITIIKAVTSMAATKAQQKIPGDGVLPPF